MQTTVIAYYSESGNTESIARSVFARFPQAEMLPLSQLSDIVLDDLSLLILGMPIHSDAMPEIVVKLLRNRNLSGQELAVFFTHTGPMDDETVVRFKLELSVWIREKGAVLKSLFHCRAENKRPDVMNWLKENMPDRYELALTAKGYPVQDDYLRAEAWAQSLSEGAAS